MIKALLCLAIVGAVCCRGRERAWWLGVAVFGWAYLRSTDVLYFWLKNPVQSLLETIGPLLGIPMDIDASNNWGVRQQTFFQIGHNLWALIFAVLGGFLAWAIFGAAAGRTAETAPGSPVPEVVPRAWWILPSVMMLSGLSLVASISLVCARLEPGLWAGLTYLLTWWLFGMIALGALFGRGRRREFWIGASLFGAGFLVLVFKSASVR